MVIRDVLEALPLFCFGGPLLILGVLLIEWLLYIYSEYHKRNLSIEKMQLENDALRLKNIRTEKDMPLIMVQNGSNRMYVARGAFLDESVAYELTEKAIETTRPKPLDRLQSFVYSPRKSTNMNNKNPELEAASNQLYQLIDNMDNDNFSLNGNEDHAEE